MTDPIPPHVWGRDHLTTLLYIETRVVDHNGVLANQHMRCDFGRHPLLAHNRQPNGRNYPTRVNDGGPEVHDHDDWDCLYDLSFYGLLEIITPTDPAIWRVPRGKRGPMNTLDTDDPSVVRVKLTDDGWAVCAALRKYRGEGGNIDTYRVKLAVAG